MSKSPAGFLGDGAVVACDFAIDFRMASGLALEGERLAFMFDGERGISGDTAFEGGAMLARFTSLENEHFVLALIKTTGASPPRLVRARSKRMRSLHFCCSHLKESVYPFLKDEWIWSALLHICRRSLIGET